MTDKARLSPQEAAAVLGRSRPLPTQRGASPVAVKDLVGEHLDGTSATYRVGGGITLLLFLAADCMGCEELFEAATTPSLLGIEEGDVLIVVRRREGIVAHKEPAGILVSPDGFVDYRVDGTPFFSLIVPDMPTVATEGVAWGAQGVKDAVGRALAGSFGVDVPRLDR